MAFVVIDTWQGRGVGSILMRHLIKIASDAGLKELTAEVLPENAAMIKVFRKFGFSPTLAEIPRHSIWYESSHRNHFQRGAPARFRSGDVAEDMALGSTSGTPVRAYLSPKGERR